MTCQEFHDQTISLCSRQADQVSGSELLAGAKHYSSCDACREWMTAQAVDELVSSGATEPERAHTRGILWEKMVIAWTIDPEA
jgi:hypothetical protein